MGPGGAPIFPPPNVGIEIGQQGKSSIQHKKQYIFN